MEAPLTNQELPEVEEGCWIVWALKRTLSEDLLRLLILFKRDEDLTEVMVGRAEPVVEADRGLKKWPSLGRATELKERERKVVPGARWRAVASVFKEESEVRKRLFPLPLL